MMPELGAMPIIEGFSRNIYECETTGRIIQFYHETMRYPCTSTWCKYITIGYFNVCTGFNAARIRCFIKVVDETEMGNMDQQRQDTGSTNPIPIKPDTMEEVPQLPNNNSSHHVYMTINDLDGKLYSDQTGRFPITSNRGNFYVVILYAVDGNYKSHYLSQVLKAYDDVYDFLQVQGYQPQLHKMENQTSKDVETFIVEQQAKVQYTPADIHRTNIDERCCHTWKKHLTAVRAGAPQSFCIENWCRTTEQYDITLKMMQPCTLNPCLSAFESMEGMFYFDATPMAPVGTETIIHLKPLRRHTWSYHAFKAWYFSPSFKQYLVIKITNKAGLLHTTDTWK